jgi:nickel transport protein
MKHRLPILLATLGGIGWVTPVLAHGVRIEYQPTESIQIEARYDTGEPMQGAQVMVYSPKNLADPWTQGTTDDQGRFVFAPDTSQPGNWEVTVRQAGHGDIVAIPIGGNEATVATGDAAPTGEATAETMDEATDRPEPAAAESPAVAPQSAQLSPVQQGITIGAVIWGFIGTALFFARGKR